MTAAGVLAAGALATVDPNEPGHYPTCPFLAVSGLWCPGCGSLRATHALVTGDPVTALERNPLAVVLLPVVLVAWAAWGLRILGVRAWHPTRVPAPVIWTLCAVVVVYGVTRNLPGMTFLSPA